MAYMQRIVFSLLTLTIITTNLATQNNHHNANSIIPSLYAPKNSEKVWPDQENDPLEEHFQQENQSFLFSEKEIAAMETVFKSSPEEAQFIINHLQDPTYFPMSENYRSVIFVGEPGTGKTISARYILHKMSQHGWNHTFLSSTELLGEYRNGTARKLKRKLKASIASGKPTIVVIDELHRLLENSESKHHDSDTAATALWTFLDAQKKNKNFFLIGTMNRADKLPKPYKSRILFDRIDFPIITDPKIQSQTLRNIFKDNNIQVDSEITDTFLMQECEKMGPCAGRYLENLAVQACRVAKMSNPNTSNIIIKKASLSQAVNKFIHSKTSMRYDIEEETDEQRQERHHKETIDLQKKYHEEQLLLHKEDQEKQELQLLEQLFMQINQRYGSRYFLTLYKEGSDSEEKKLFTKNKNSCKEGMANVYAMKQFVAAEKIAKETRSKSSNTR